MMDDSIDGQGVFVNVERAPTVVFVHKSGLGFMRARYSALLHRSVARWRSIRYGCDDYSQASNEVCRLANSSKECFGFAEADF